MGKKHKHDDKQAAATPDLSFLPSAVFGNTDKGDDAGSGSGSSTSADDGARNAPGASGAPGAPGAGGAGGAGGATVNIGIDQGDRSAIADGLSKLLADTYTLYLTTHNFHWNVTGPMFNTLHGMFMTQYTELWNAVDPVAERIRSLGHAAPGSYAQFGELTSIADVPRTPPKAMEMVRILKEGHEAVARTARAVFPVADKAGDEPTADLLTQRLTVHEQAAWMLRSMLEE